MPSTDPPQTPDLAAARRLYDAFAARDGQALFEALTPTFRGVVSEGMPLGAGGVHHGASAMLTGCWGPVFGALDIGPVPDEYLPTADGRVVVVGRYRGQVRETGRPVEAAFVHLLRFEDGRVSELVQVTDTQRWHEALAASSPRA